MESLLPLSIPQRIIQSIVTLGGKLGNAICVNACRHAPSSSHPFYSIIIHRWTKVGIDIMSALKQFIGYCIFFGQLASQHCQNYQVYSLAKMHVV